MANRRDFICGASLLALTGNFLTGCENNGVMLVSQDIWKSWVADWTAMLARFEAIGWDTSDLKIEPPVKSKFLDRMQSEIGLPFPEQLRAVMAEHSASVQFGWSTPSHLRPMTLDEGRYPTMSGLIGFGSKLFDAAQLLDSHRSFLGWKESEQNQTNSEATNTPDMWENQVCFATVSNGDMITIDVSRPDGENQPVRYFSHELEGWHGYEIGPNFVDFMTAYSKLGCAGDTHDDWFSLVDHVDDKKRIAHLSASTTGAKRWFDYLDNGGAIPNIENAPPPKIAQSAVDIELLKAALDGNFKTVREAIKSGAEVNCIWDNETRMNESLWDTEFWTPLSFVLSQGRLDIANYLLEQGADLNTRYLAANAAVKSRQPAVMAWVIDIGGRVNGWPGQRYWPLHDIVNDRRSHAANKAADSTADNDDFLNSVISQGLPPEVIDALRTTLEITKTKRDELPQFDEVSYKEMLTLILKAGADPNAPWDNGLTMLHWGDALTAEILLQHGANVEAKNNESETAIEFWPSAEKATVLRKYGAKREPRFR